MIRLRVRDPGGSASGASASVSGQELGSKRADKGTRDRKLFLTLLGEEGMMEIEIDDDGSLQAPFGELTKKGK